MFTFMAGATITGAVVARYSVVRKSSAIPCANLARMLAVAGATTSASVLCAASMCSMAEARLPSGDFRRRPQAGDDFVSGERGEGERLDELLRRLGHDHVNIERLLLQGAHQLRCLVSGDAAGDPNRTFIPEYYGTLTAQVRKNRT